MLPRYLISQIRGGTIFLGGPSGGPEAQFYQVYTYTIQLVRVDLTEYGERHQVLLPIEHLPGAFTKTMVLGGESALDLLRDALVNRLEVSMHELDDGVVFSVYPRPDVVWLDPLSTVYAPADQTGWLGEYFDNLTLSGEPKLIRRDSEIQFDWKHGSPDPNILAADNFSARWTREGYFTPGVYQFAFWADNAVTFQVDDQPPFGGETVPALHWSVNRYLSGTHRIRVLYYERDRLARLRFWVRRLTGD